jgi:hypothetical protein
MGIRNRHWKQKYSKDAIFSWTKSVLWKGVQSVVGESIPDDLDKDRNKKKRFWETGYIELKDFIAPDVSTGRVEPVVDIIEGAVGTSEESQDDSVDQDQTIKTDDEGAEQASDLVKEDTVNWRDLSYKDQLSLAREGGLEGRLPPKADLEAFLTERFG